MGGARKNKLLSTVIQNGLKDIKKDDEQKRLEAEANGIEIPNAQEHESLLNEESNIPQREETKQEYAENIMRIAQEREAL
jgi:hypothetical protein